jgi:hypothetical protein
LGEVVLAILADYERRIGELLTEIEGLLLRRYSIGSSVNSSHR